MLTGDNARRRAGAWPRALGIDEVRAEVLPGDKAARGGGAARATAPASWRWSATASTTRRRWPPPTSASRWRTRHRRGDARRRHHADARRSAAGRRGARRLARAPCAKIRQNLFWAFAYNVVGIPLAALGLLSPVVAGAAMALSSVSVVSNALLLKRWRPHAERAGTETAR